MRLWWIPAGLVAWFVLALGVALLIGPVLRRSGEALEAIDQDVILEMDIQPSQE